MLYYKNKWNLRETRARHNAHRATSARNFVRQQTRSTIMLCSRSFSREFALLYFSAAGDRAPRTPTLAPLPKTQQTRNPRTRFKTTSLSVSLHVSLRGNDESRRNACSSYHSQRLRSRGDEYGRILQVAGRIKRQACTQEEAKEHSRRATPGFS